MAGNLTVESCANVFAPTSRQASSNYGVDSKGRIGMYVEEKDRAWTTASRSNDNRAVTIEVANDGGAPNWHVNDKAMNALIKLVADICKRNDIKKLIWKNDKSLIGQVDKQNMTVHRWFANTDCPGEYLMSKQGYIADEVNKLLGVSTSSSKPATTKTLYRIQTGAFKDKSNADAELKKVEAAGFDAILVHAGGLYKVQTGAFAVKDNAAALQAKMKKAGFSTFMTTTGGTIVKSDNTLATPVVNIKVGDKVKIKPGAHSYTNQYLASFVYEVTHTVTEVKGDRVVISYGGDIIAAMKKSDLFKG